MAFEEILESITLVAGADLSGAQYHVVKVDANGEAVLASTGEAEFVGVLQNKPLQGEAATIGVKGVTKIHSSAAITTGLEVNVGATPGQVAAGTTNVVGVALEGATGADVYSSVLLK